MDALVLLSGAYASHGIREKDLAEVAVRDLPFVTKQTLMENFDGAVTDPRLKKTGLEEWIQNHPDPREDFLGEFIVVHTSGSSGAVGIFVCDKKGWRIATSTAASNLAMPETVQKMGAGQSRQN